MISLGKRDITDKPGAEKGKTDLGKHLGTMETTQEAAKAIFNATLPTVLLERGTRAKGIFGIQT